jgi:hypothetical protein
LKIHNGSCTLRWLLREPLNRDPARKGFKPLFRAGPLDNFPKVVAESLFWEWKRGKPPPAHPPKTAQGSLPLKAEKRPSLPRGDRFLAEPCGGFGRLGVLQKNTLLIRFRSRPVRSEKTTDQGGSPRKGDSSLGKPKNPICVIPRKL